MSGSMERIPPVIAGRYRVLEELGRGGMGVVYRARDDKHDRDVAVKVLRPELASALETHRFHREIRIAAGLSHPHILPIYDSGEVEGRLYYVMPHVPGETLRQRLDRHGPLPIPQVLTLGRNIAAALDHAHARNVVHRDIKPANIFLNDDEAMVGDFGVAVVLTEALLETRLTTEGVAVGSPRYMSPEQLTDPDRVDERSDVFSFGVVLFECVTGHLPFAGEEGRSHPLGWMAREPGDVGENCPAPLASFILRCLAVDRKDRLPGGSRLSPAWQAVEDEIRESGRAGLSRRAVGAGAVLLVGLTATAVALVTDRSPPERTVLAHVPVVTWESREEEGRFVPGRDEISFRSDRDGAWNVWVAAPDGSDARAITSRASGVATHVWSPDGSRLALVSFSRDGYVLILSSLETELESAEVPLPGRRPPQLVRWRADGLHLLMDGELWSVDPPPGLRLRQRTDRAGLPRLLEADVHPIDDRIVYAAPRGDGGADLWLTTLEGATAERLTDEDASDRYPCWLSEDEIAFVSDRGGRNDVWRIPLSDRRARAVTTSGSIGISGIACSSESPAVLLDRQSERADLWLFDRETGRSTPLTVEERVDLLPSASPDGRVVFQRERAQAEVSEPLLDADVMAGRLVDGRLRDVTMLVENAFAPRVSSDGRWVAFQRRSPPHNELGVVGPSGEVWSLTDRLPLSAYRSFPPVGWERTNAVWGGPEPTLFFFERADPSAAASPAMGWTLVRARMTPDRPRVDTVHSLDPHVRPAGLSVSSEGSHLAYVAAPEGRDVIELRVVEPDGERVLYREDAADELYQLGWLDLDGPAVVALRTFLRPSTTEVQPVLLGLDGRIQPRTTIRGAVMGHAWLDRASSGLLVPTIRGDTMTLHRLPLEAPADAPWETEMDGVPFSGIEVLADGRILFSRHDVNPDLWRVTLGGPR